MICYRQVILAAALIGSVLLPQQLPAQGSPLLASQYTETWNQYPGFQESGLVWDLGATYNTVYQALSPSIVSTIISANNASSLAFYQANFQNKLYQWFLAEVNSNASDQAVAADLVTFLNQVYASVGPQLAQMYPGYPSAVYQGLVVQNLVHGSHTYAPSEYYNAITRQYYTPNPSVLMLGQVTMVDEFISLMRAPVADCGNIAELVRVTSRLWGLDTRYVGIWVDYDSPTANGLEIASTHAIDILVYADSAGVNNAILLDAQTNVAIAPGPMAAVLPGEMAGDGIIASASNAGARYSALSASGKVLRFFDWYLYPPVRVGYLNASMPDASLAALMDVYYLESYPNSHQPIDSSNGWRVNTAAYSLQQRPY
jgi:hypothetical protein